MKLKQVRIQPKTPDNYRTIIKALAEKNTSFHTFKPKEHSYRVVLKHMHFSINPSEIQPEIEKFGHTVTNIFNVKHVSPNSHSQCSLLTSNLPPTTKTSFKLNTYSIVRSNSKHPIIDVTSPNAPH
jgi:hypothetical protein